MKIFEVVNKNFYHGSYDKLEPGTVLTPKGKDYEAAWGGTGFYGALEKHRPPEQLAHKEGVFMVANPDDVDNAGGATDYIYAVVPMGEPQRHDMNWGTAISSLLDNGARLNDSEIKFAADQYWSGKPHPDGNSVWEFIAPRAKIVSELAEGNKAQSFVKPQLDVEWEEANRYPEFRKIGKDAWIELASKGKAVTVKDASDINNTDAGDPDSFKTLDPAKQKRALAQVKSGNVELPVVAVYSDGHKELIGGNTRLTAMMAKQGKGTVWQFEVPDEVAELAEGNKAQKGIPANATLSKLDKIRSTTKDPAKRKRAHWLANMRRGSNKK